LIYAYRGTRLNIHWDRDVVTFSFNQTIPDSYDEDGEDIGWEPLNREQQDAVRRGYI